MRAAVLLGKEAIRVEEVTPASLQAGEVRVRIEAALTCGTDLKVFKRGYHARMLIPPTVFGHEFAGVISELAPDVTSWRPGERVAVANSAPCGCCFYCQNHQENLCDDLLFLNGAYARSIVIPARIVQKNLLRLRPETDFCDAALVEPLACVVQGVEDSGLRAGQRVLVIGAGPIGLSVIQFVIARGAAVAVMDVAESRLEFCRRQMGVKHTLQPGPGTPDSLRAIGGGDLPTVVIDATGNSKSMAGAFELPAHGGRIVFVGLFQGDLSFNDPSFHRRELTLLASRNALPGTFRDIIALIEAGRVDTAPWISNRLSLWDVPRRFPDFAGNPAIIKTMIDVSD
jgi:2-desacetyl-2-hydroxyethyl bacteriochlorophyllide A dehydrogenase